MAPGELPDDLREWVETATGGTVERSEPHLSGASRQAWAVDVVRDESRMDLFLLRDTGRGGGSARDAAVLAALGGTDVPTPALHGSETALRAVLLQRIEGHDEFDDDPSHDAALDHLMEVVATLHGTDPSALDIDHLGPPDRSTDHAATQLGAAEAVADLVGDALHPLFSVALAWLRRAVPDGAGRTALVHSDLGPGNLVHRDGRIEALLDWEVAHWGDPMEDLAALAVRDMATPVGDLSVRFAAYERHGGPPVDRPTVAWYRILILTRNAMLIGLGLSSPDPATDRPQLTMYRTLLMRGLALALADAVGAPRPTEPPFTEAPPSDALALVSDARDQLDETIAPAITDQVARGRAHGLAGLLGTVDHHLRFGGDRDARELDDLAALLGHRPSTVADGLADVADLAARPEREAEVVAYLARNLTREAMLAAPLLGELSDRLPQPLGER
ncbi:MAG: phosphotransferase family protein [Acidimicrobiales bacterium]|jgi:aminoglycoside phosphotransferase (APT) family kinase protein|nr:phosphotransferase family protein [Acidimicrobiales bacterium]